MLKMRQGSKKINKFPFKIMPYLNLQSILE